MQYIKLVHGDRPFTDLLISGFIYQNNVNKNVYQHDDRVGLQ